VRNKLAGSFGSRI